MKWIVNLLIALLTALAVYLYMRPTDIRLSAAEELRFLRIQALVTLTKDADAKKKRALISDSVVNKILADHKCPNCELSFNLDEIDLNKPHILVTIPAPVPVTPKP